MGNFAHDLSGGAAVLKKYATSSDVPNAGVHMVDAGTGVHGIVIGTTTGAADVVGVAQDASGTAVTADQQLNATEVTVVVNPLAVYRYRMSGGATDGTQLGLWTNSAASTTGERMTITTGDTAPNSPDLDDGTMACVSGNNVGRIRLIEATAATTADAEPRFVNTLAVGDTFILVAPSYFPNSNAGVQFTTLLYECDVTSDWSSGASVAAGRVYHVEFDFSSVTNARQKSYVYLYFTDQIFHGV